MTAVGIEGFGLCLDGFYDPSVQIQMNVYRRTTEYLERGRSENDALRTPEDIRVRQKALREYVDGVLGGLPTERPAPSSRVTGLVKRPTYVIEKHVLQVGPRRPVTGNLYLPRDLDGPTGAVLFLCGHADRGKAADRYQAFCARLAANGLVVLAIDSIGQGERRSYLDRDGHEAVPPNVLEHNHAGVQCWWNGDTIARYFVDDARRAIDYLSSRPEVDPDRIGVAGNSGGATQATWLMLAEPRIAAAALGCFIMSRHSYMWSGGAQDAEQIVPGGALAGIDHEDFLIAMAPRPVLVMSANYDFFPVEGAVETVDRARRVYEVLGNPEGLSHVRSSQLHGLNDELAMAGAEFFVRHLGAGPGAPIDHSAPELATEVELRCTESGQLRFDEPGLHQVFELNHARLEALQATPSTSAARWLEERVRQHRRPHEEFFPRWQPPQDHRVGDVALISQKAIWWAEADVLNAGVFVRPANGEMAAVEIACFDGGTGEISARTEWVAERVARGIGVLVLDVRGVGALLPHEINPFPLEESYGTVYKLMTDLIWLGDSLAAARVFDILQAVEFVTQDENIGGGAVPIHAFGAGHGAFLAYLAAALEPRIVRTELESAPLDPASVVRTRLHGPQSNWQHVIPGMAVHCRLGDLRAEFDGRVLEIGGSAQCS